VSRPFSAVVPLRTEGGRPPIFCVHGGEGDVFDLRWLARLLGDDQPFYGLQMIDSAEVRRAARSIPDLAAYYLDTVRAVRPDGPIVLCGYSSGGFVAYEMARQTAARGEPPPVLVLLDTPARHDGTRRREFERSRLAALPPTARLRRRVKARLFRARLAGYARMGTHVPGRRRRVFRLYLSGRAVAGYRIEPYDGPVLLTRARDREAPAAPDLGWGGHAVGPFRVVDVPGGHHSFLRWPNVETLALALRGALDDMAAHAPSSGGTQS
jgi:aspartate racemase